MMELEVFRAFCKYAMSDAQKKSLGNMATAAMPLPTTAPTTKHVERAAKAAKGKLGRRGKLGLALAAGAGLAGAGALAYRKYKNRNKTQRATPAEAAAVHAPRTLGGGA